MRTFEVLSAVILLAVAVSAQYQYQKPPPPPPPPRPTPKNVYLPPTTTFKYESDQQIAAEGQKPDAEHEPGMPFDFTYAVKDDTGNDFSHAAESNGDVVKGEYRTLLPDGRLQIVKYTADWKNGYNAEVTYEGEPSYPEPPKTTAKPVKNPYENEEIIDSQGLTPPPKPRPTTTRAPYVPPPPPPTTRPPPPPPPRTTRPPYVPPTTRATLPPRTTQPPVEPPGLYGAPSLPFGHRNNPKFGYNSRK